MHSIPVWPEGSQRGVHRKQIGCVTLQEQQKKKKPRNQPRRSKHREQVRCVTLQQPKEKKQQPRREHGTKHAIRQTSALAHLAGLSGKTLSDPENGCLNPKMHRQRTSRVACLMAPSLCFAAVWLNARGLRMTTSLVCASLMACCSVGLVAPAVSVRVTVDVNHSVTPDEF